MYKRKIINKLQEWLRSPSRKPLLILGARQVGKTTLLREFGHSHFPRLHEINFEERPDLHKVFEGSLEPGRLVEILSLALNTEIDVERDLMLFDEIQACPSALTSLKYFAEKLPQLAVCAAGSLLRLSLNEGSFPVGKVDRISLYPMSFDEFLMAHSGSSLEELIGKYQHQTEIPAPLHNRLWSYLLLYFISGGLPEVVKISLLKDVSNRERYDLIRKKQQTIIRDYLADFAKHSGKANSMHLERIFTTSAEQIGAVHDGSTKRFAFKGVVPGVSQYSRLASAFDWLEKAGLLIKVPVVQKISVPLASQSKESIFKAFPFDVGILGALAYLPPEQIAQYDYGSFKGFFAENFVAQELITLGLCPLYSWSEAKSEVEFVFQLGADIVPIEVKSGSRTRSKSLGEYRRRYSPQKSMILSGKPNISRDSVMTLPIYAIQLLEGMLRGA